MKATIEELREKLGENTEVAEATAAEAAEEPATNPALDSHNAAEGIVDEEIEQAVKEQVRENVRNTIRPSDDSGTGMAEALKEIGQALQQPNVQRILAEAWYGTDGLTEGVEADPEAPELDPGGDQVQTDQQPATDTDSDMFNSPIKNGDDSTDPQIDPDVLHALLTDMMQSAADLDHEFTAPELVQYMGVTYSLTQNLAQRAPAGWDMGDLVEYEQDNREDVKADLAEMVKEI